MSNQNEHSFGALLKRYRGRAGLTQEALAEAAGISVRGLSDLERGVSGAPRASTSQLLSTALALGPDERLTFEHAARPVADAIAISQHHSTCRRTNIPASVSTLVGRTRERGEVQSLLATSRLVTLTGSGGIGKTRLAQEVARDLLPHYPDGVWFIELAALIAPDLVIQTIASELHLHEAAGHPLLSVVTDFFSSKTVLLVLDNCEHLIGACADLACTLLRNCSGLHLLATSREPLRIPGEMVWRVPPLSLPHNSQPQELMGSDAVALLLARTRAQRSDFTLTAWNSEAVYAVCRQLDGVPLAIELAAARTAAFSLEQIASAVNDTLRILADGPRTAAPRQRSLLATIEWSYDLLNPSEQVLLRRLSVFAGGWTLEAVQEICRGLGDLHIATVDMLASLVTKSLVQMRENADGVRYSLLDTIRQFAAKHLAASGERDELQTRHLDFYTALAIHAEQQMASSEEIIWLDRLEADSDNMRTALTWASTNEQCPEHVLRLAEALWPLWQIRGLVSEGRKWLACALSRGQDAPTTLRAQASLTLANLASAQGDWAIAKQLTLKAYALCQDDRNQIAKKTKAEVLSAAAALARADGDFVQDAALLDQARMLYQDCDNAWGIAATIVSFGFSAQARGDLDAAVDYFKEALTLQRVQHDRSSAANTLRALGWVLVQQGSYEHSIPHWQECLELYRSVGDERNVASTLQGLGLLALRHEDFDRARTTFSESLRLARNLDNKLVIVQALVRLSLLSAWDERHDEAEMYATESVAVARLGTDPANVAESLQTAASAFAEQGKYGQARALFTESLAFARTANAQSLIAFSLWQLSYIACQEGLYLEATAQAEESLILYRQLSAKPNVIQVLLHQGSVAVEQGMYAQGQMLFQEALNLTDNGQSDLYLPACALACLAKVAVLQERFDSAAAWAEESVLLFRQFDMPHTLVYALGIMAASVGGQGDYGRATHLHKESLTTLERIRNRQHRRYYAAWELAELATCVVDHPDLHVATRLLGASRTLQRPEDILRLPAFRALRDQRTMAHAKATLGEEVFQAAWAQGSALTIDGAIEYALSVLDN